MRCRPQHSRYRVVVMTARPVLSGDPWSGERVSGMLAQPCWRPATDVFETADTVAVTVDLAGIDDDDLDVQLYENALIVEGRRRLARADDQGVYHMAEIRQGPFRLEVALPACVDPDRVTARYDRGLLNLTIAKRRGGDPDGR